MLRQITHRFLTSGNVVRHFSSMYEPDYLEKLRPKYPLHNTLNFTIKGYDYPILESYQRFVHNVADTLDLDIAECWAQPPQKRNVQKFKPASAVIESEYKLTTYERNVQIVNLQAPLYPTFLRLLQAALPEGVTLTVSEHTSDVDDGRYVPDRELLELRQKLDEMGGSRDKNMVLHIKGILLQHMSVLSKTPYQEDWQLCQNPGDSNSSAALERRWKQHIEK